MILKLLKFQNNLNNETAIAFICLFTFIYFYIFDYHNPAHKLFRETPKTFLIKGTLIQIWKFPYMVVLIKKQYP